VLKRFCSVWRFVAVFAAGALYLALSGCATWQAPAKVDDTALRARAVSATEQDVRLSAAVLSAEDSRQMLGADVNGTGVQPIWIEVENPTPQALWLLRSGTDPDYFSSLEVAWSFHAPLAGATNARIDDHFVALAFENPIPAWSTRAGIIFANPHRHTRLLNVDLLGRCKLIPFTLFPPVPDDAPDTEALQVLARFAETQGTDYSDPDAFRAALEQLPCCATQANGTASGDPLNVVLVGEFADIAAALVRRGFRRDEMEFDHAQRLYGRPPDIVARKSGQGGVPANWVRMWVAPFRYRGQSVCLVQTGRPVGGRFTVAEGKALVLHPDVDEARNLLVQDLLYSGGLAKLGFVAGVSSISIARPWVNPASSSYHTDGLRAVMFLATRPLDLSDVQILDWVPYLKRREVGAAKENTNAQ
jgi:hypothetical protein